MWDLTVQDDHDFYVEPDVTLPPSRAGPSDVAVLVHNCGEYNNFYGGSEGGVMATLDKDGVLSLAIEKGPTTPSGGQMFGDAVNNFGTDNINAVAGKWVRAMPSNLNTFNDLVRSGMSPEEAAASTFTGKMAARFGFTDVSITSLSGEPGADTCGRGSRLGEPTALPRAVAAPARVSGPRPGRRTARGNWPSPASPEPPHRRQPSRSTRSQAAAASMARFRRGGPGTG